MPMTVISMNPEADRQARALLKRLCEDGPEMSGTGNAEAARLLEQRGFAVTINGTISVTDKGRGENDSRVLSGRA